ncbi:MAG TPA: hypothetical protein VM241_04955 [Candidatus Thermoplasmatota archaeon]|jgi:hypothetical protein|nr:hypothetical protein [Candidatus Thermoplasmatota archaeon]
MASILDVEHGLGPQTVVRRLDRADLACLASVLPGALAPKPPMSNGLPLN